MEPLPPEIQATAWELRVGCPPRQTAALNGNILRLALSREPFQVTGSFAKFLLAISEVSRLLWFLHQEGIVHRDLKPDHVLLADDAVTLIGFLPPPKQDASSSVGAAFIGTPGYAPPEQARGEDLIEPKSDIFSLGAILYEAVTHQVPFRGNLLAVKLATLTEDPPPIRKLAPQCPASLISLCELMLAKDPTLRPSADEVRQQLIEIAKESSGLVLPLFSEKRNMPVSSPSPVKAEPEKFSSEELLDRIFPYRSPPPKVQPFDTRSPGIAHPMSAKGRYLLEHEVGQGGIGKVSQAHDQRLQRTVAIKELLHPDNADAKERFLREALLTARLQHPAIVPIYDVGVRSSGEIFYSMRFISGKPLNELAEEKPFYERLALLPHLLTVAEAIAYAHSQKIIHRDLKPQNILVGEFGETVVIDWGSGKDLNENEPPKRQKTPRTPIEILAAQEVAANSNKTPNLTMEGSIIGTPAYMAPEQALGRRVNETADVFALGAILYHLLAGKAPVRDKEKLMEQAQEGIFVPLKEVEPKTPEELLAIVQKAMAKAPKDRYPTAISFAEDLRRYQRGQLINAHQYSLRERFFKYVRKHKQVFAVIAASVVMLAATGAYSIQQIIQEKNATRRSLNNLMLMQARNELEKNPAKSITWLKQLPPDYPDLDKARIIASDAIRRGIPYAIEEHEGRINHLLYRKDNVISGSSDGTIRIWNPQTRQATRVLRSSSSVIHFGASQDGNLIAGVHGDGTIRVWDVSPSELTSGQPLYELKPPKGASSFCAISPDARYLAISGDSTGESSASYLWDLSTQEMREIFPSKEPAHNLQFSPDGQLLASVVRTSETRSEVQLYNPETRSTQTLPIEDEAKLLYVEFSPNGSFLAAAGDEGDLYLWNLTTGLRTRLEGHSGTISEIEFSNQEDRLASGGQDRSISLWDTKTGLLLSKYKGHDGSIRDLEFSHHGNLLASASGDKTIQLWDLTNDQHRHLRRHEDIAQAIAFSADDKILTSGGFDSLLLLWEVEPSDHKLLFQQEAPVYAVAISDDASLVAAQKGDSISVWSTTTFEETSLTTKKNLAVAMDFSPSKRFLAVSDIDGGIEIFNIQSKNSITIANSKSPAQKIQFIQENIIIFCTNNGTIETYDIEKSKRTIISEYYEINKYKQKINFIIPSFYIVDNNKLILIANSDTESNLEVLDLNTNKKIKSIRLNDRVFDLSVSKDKKYIAFSTPSSVVRVWELSALLSGSSEPTVLEGHKDQTVKVAFFGEDHLLLSTSSDSNLRLWDATNKESSAWVGHTGTIVGLAVARDGSKVAISSDLGGAVHLWWERVPETTPMFLQWLQSVPSAVLPDNVIK